MFALKAWLLLELRRSSWRSHKKFAIVKNMDILSHFNYWPSKIRVWGFIDIRI
jgi:hypothetical protein